MSGQGIVRATELDPFELHDGVWDTLEASLPEAKPTEHPIRLAFAAPHVVMDDAYAAVRHDANQPGTAADITSHIDWESTLDIRTHLADQGLGIAEAMDTAQRFDIGWTASHELIQRTGEAGLDFVAGAGCDHRNDVNTTTLLIDAVVEQVHEIRRCGGSAVLLPMPLLPRLNVDAQGYVNVYSAIIDQCQNCGPLIVHWLGEQFMPALAGYFPGDAFLRVMRHNPEVVRAAKLSLLDADRERMLRAAIAADDQLMLTGDDFHFGQLMTDDHIVDRMVPFGDRMVPLGNFSHALLGVFGVLGGPSSIAFRAMAAGDHAAASHVLRSCEQLGQVVFEAPTPLYKAGLAFLAYVNDLQDVFDLPNHLQRQRNRQWYARVLQAASACGAIADAPTAAQRAMYVLG
jgi:hypothetical protein